MAPRSAANENEQGQYHVSRLESVVTATGVSRASFRNLEIRFARGAGVGLGRIVALYH